MECMVFIYNLNEWNWKFAYVYELKKALISLNTNRYHDYNVRNGMYLFIIWINGSAYIYEPKKVVIGLNNITS